MSIDFDAKRWAAVKRNASLWWEGKLDRPLIQISVGGRDPGRRPSRFPHRHFTSYFAPSVSAGEVVDSWDYMLSQQRYIGDGFPGVWPNFGAGVLAAMLGARLVNGEPPYDTTWFHPEEDREIADIRFQFDPDNVWVRRIQDILRAARDRWQGLVQVGMTDLGGNLDVLSTFRPGERLLLDLYDHPTEVKRLTEEEHLAWWQAFDALDAVIRPVNPGYTAWAPIYSETPYYMLQCDFCYMIGPEMFDEFVKPELAASCRRLPNAFYHLDGPGQLPHLDSLLSIPELKGVQWVPGAGAKSFAEWPEVYRRIREAGKLAQSWLQWQDGASSIERLADQLGSVKGFVFFGWVSAEQEGDAIRLCEKFGAM